jgi:hypothetical protein
MKKTQVILTMGLLLGLLFAAANVFADTQAPTTALVKPTKVEDTPGAKATEKAAERAAQASAHVSDNAPGAKATEKANERAAQGSGNSSENVSGAGASEKDDKRAIQGSSNSPGAEETEEAGERDTEKPEELEGERSNFKGTVTAAGGESLTLALANGASMTFVITDATKIKVPGVGADATLADVKTGAQATVGALQTEAGTWIALRIHVSSKPEKIHRDGIVTQYVAGVSVTIMAKDGYAYTFAITADTKMTPWHRVSQLGVGTRVKVSAVRDATGAEWMAQHIGIHPKSASSTTPPATATPTTTATVTATPTVTATGLPPVTSTPTATATQVSGITWDGYVGPLLAAKCTGCHGTVLKLGGVSLSTYQSALAVVVPGDPAGSKLVKKLQTNAPPHQLPMDELANVIAWIEAGAPEK